MIQPIPKFLSELVNILIFFVIRYLKAGNLKASLRFCPGIWLWQMDFRRPSGTLLRVNHIQMWVFFFPDCFPAQRLWLASVVIYTVLTFESTSVETQTCREESNLDQCCSFPIITPHCHHQCYKVITILIITVPF